MYFHALQGTRKTEARQHRKRSGPLGASGRCCLRPASLHFPCVLSLAPGPCFLFLSVHHFVESSPCPMPQKPLPAFGVSTKCFILSRVLAERGVLGLRKERVQGKETGGCVSLLRQMRLRGRMRSVCGRQMWVMSAPNISGSYGTW